MPRDAPNVSNPARPRPSPSRRTFLKAGVAGGAALLLVRWLHAPATSPESRRAALTPSARAILLAVIPAFLDGALPAGAPRSTARVQTLAGIEEAIAGLPPASREELADLFSLLDFAPARWFLAGVRSSWSEASTESVAAVLERWRDSRLALLRSAYGALHQLVLAGWYAQPGSWPATGYGGPPALTGE